jgi:hypothetical protein
MLLIACVVCWLSSAYPVFDSETAWIRPGCHVEVCDSISLGGHVEPTMDNARSTYGCQASFQMIDGVERWRVVLVGDGSVVVFEEDSSPRTYPFVADPEYIHISLNNRFVVAGSFRISSNPDSLFRIALLDLESGLLTLSLHEFPAHRQVPFVANDGRLAALGTTRTVDLTDLDSPIIRSIPEPAVMAGNLNIDPEGRCYTAEIIQSGDDECGFLWAFNWDGTLRWQSGCDSELSFAHDARFSSDGELIICLVENAVALVRASDGSVLSTIQAFVPGRPVVSRMGNVMATIVWSELDDIWGDRNLLVACLTTPAEMYEVELPDFHARTWLSCVSDNGRVLVGRGDMNETRYILMDSAGVLYVTPPFNRSTVFTSRENSTSDDYTNGGSPTAISSDGSRCLICTGEMEFDVVRIAAR